MVIERFKNLFKRRETPAEKLQRTIREQVSSVEGGDETNREELKTALLEAWYKANCKSEAHDPERSLDHFHGPGPSTAIPRIDRELWRVATEEAKKLKDRLMKEFSVTEEELDKLYKEKLSEEMEEYNSRK